MHGVLLAVLADDVPSISSSPGLLSLVGVAIVSISGVVVAYVQRGRRNTRQEDEAEDNTRIIAARVAAESTVETALESWDRIIGQPQRDEIVALRKALDRRGGELSDAQAQLSVLREQNLNLSSQLSQAHNEINRLLKALVKRNDDSG